MLLCCWPLQVTVALLEAGANVDAVTPGGVTSMHLAARSGHLLIVAALARKGGNINCVDEKGYTPVGAGWRAGYSCRWVHGAFVVCSAMKCKNVGCELHSRLLRWQKDELHAKWLSMSHANMIENVWLIKVLILFLFVMTA